MKNKTIADYIREADEKRAREEAEFGEVPEGIVIEDFYAYAEQNTFIYKKNGRMWPMSTINSRLAKKDGLKPSVWLHRHQPVEQMTWAPGQPTLIKNKLIIDGGWIDSVGVTTYNLYHPANIVLGQAADAEPWIEHVHKIYPDDADHIIQWFAYRTQHANVKINHALVLAGDQGIGKDTMLYPVLYAVGPWNCKSVNPTQLLGRFNGFRKSVILVVSEARDLGEINRPQFYEATKEIIAAPPEVLLVDEKNTHEYWIPNLTGVIITSNHKTSGIYLPPNDRRHYVAWSPRQMADFPEVYWNRLWAWLLAGGCADVAAYLHQLDVRTFNPHAPPPKTQAFHEIVNSSRSPEDNEIADVLDKLGWPEAVTVMQIENAADEGDLRDWLKDRRNRKIIPRRLEACDYVAVSKPGTKDGRWRISGRNTMVYAKASLTYRDQIAAIHKLVDEGEWYGSGA